MARQKKNNNIEDVTKNLIEGAPMTLDGELENLQLQIDLARVELEKTKVEIEEKKKEAKFEGRREISQDEKDIIDRQISRTNTKAAAESVVQKQKAIDSQLVTGKFMNRRNPGQGVKLPYMKYAEDPVKWWPFEEGKVYTIPRGFADQINEHYHVPTFIKKEGVQNPDGESAIHSVDTSNKKYAFVPVGF